MNQRLADTLFLFDGALLQGSPFLASLLEHPGLGRLYEEEGEQAAQVGPLLLPAESKVHHWVSQLAQQNIDFAYGFNILRSPARAEIILDHLRGLRFISAGNKRHYYFRFADGRAFATVWATLTPQQRQSVLGPLQEWHHHDHAGVARCARPSQEHPPGPSAESLELLPNQWHQVLAATRIAELFHATSKINYGPPAQGSHAERYAWTVRAVAMFQRLKADAVPVRMATTLAVWQTAARVLDEESFEHAVRQAQATGDIRGILSFGHRPPKTKVR